MSRSMRSPAELGLVVFDLVARWWRAAQQTARLAIGLPDYDVYVAHMRRVHPDVAPMDRDAFFRERMEARYAKGRSRCC
ncbi:MAG: YbdD/YjiX family protein [Pseudomonas sp.]|nr:YbdD/YjiX family protein [Pseudomonas sp.]